jgi:hypothetical protein
MLTYDSKQYLGMLWDKVFKGKKTILLYNPLPVDFCPEKSLT